MRTLTVNPIKWQRYVVILMLLLTPFLNIYDIYSFFEGVLRSHARAPAASLPLKYSKDILFIFLFFLGMIWILWKRKVYFSGVYYFLIFSFAASLIISFLFSRRALLTISGIRWFEPVLLIPFIWQAVNDTMQKRIAIVLLWLFWLNFAVQLIELLIIRSPYYGLNSFGLPTRSPGLFIIPSTAAFFIISTAFYLFNYRKLRAFSKVFYSTLFFIAVALTASGTGIIVYLLFLACEFYAKIKEKIVIIIGGAISGMAVFLLLPLITGRGDIFISIATRAKIFFSSLSWKDMLFSLDFGKSTNTAVQLNLSGSAIVDSLYTSLIGNIGIIGFLFFIIFLFHRISPMISKKLLIEFVLVNLFFGISVIVFEAFPMNLLFAINLIYIQKGGGDLQSTPLMGGLAFG